MCDLFPEMLNVLYDKIFLWLKSKILLWQNVNVKKKMYMDNIFYLVTCLLNYNETRNKIAIQIKYDKLKL